MSQPLTRSEEIELQIYRWLKSLGMTEWHQVRLSELAQKLGGVDDRLLNYAVLRLHRRQILQLGKWNGGVRVLYEPNQSPGLFDAPFDLLMTPEGQEYFERLAMQADDLAAASSDQIIFVSCGQCSPEEIALGTAVERTINDEMISARGYFARNQTSLSGVTEHILSQLNRAAGFIAIMHHRGTVARLDGEHIRGSVWVEQEIAIAAFLMQAQRKSMPALAYIEKGIHLEGLRGYIMFNPVEFETIDEVLADLQQRIRSRSFAVDGPESKIRLRLVPKFEIVRRDPDRDLHQYNFTLSVMNEGEKESNYALTIEFPAAFMDQSGVVTSEVSGRTTATHRFFRILSKNQGGPLEPGDTRQVFSIRYRMDHDLERLPGWPELSVTVTLRADGMGPTVIRRSMLELTEF